MTFSKEINGQDTVDVTEISRFNPASKDTETCYMYQGTDDVFAIGDFV